MDWLTFTSSVIESLAWPVALLTLVLLLKTQIKQLVKALTRIKMGDMEFEFAKAAEAVTVNAQALPTIDAQAVKAVREGVVDPTMVVLSNWRAVEDAIRQYYGWSEERPIIWTGAFRLEIAERFGKEVAAVANDLRNLQRHVVHSPRHMRVTPEEAAAFKRSADFLINAIKQAMPYDLTAPRKPESK